MTTKSKDPNTEISILDAVNMIDDRRENDIERTARDRTRQRIKYAIENGELRLMNGKLLRGEFVGWAQNKWKGQLIDYPAIYSGKVAGATSQTYIKVSAHNPQTLDEAMRIIQRQQAEIDSLRPDAEKWRCWDEKKRKAPKA